jgi:hypothetical protein
MNAKSFLTRILIVFAVILLIASSTLPVAAMLAKCRTDPIFVLSNGDILKVTLDISTDATNVRNLTYIVHVPAGVTVKNVAYTAGGLGFREIYKVYQDSPAKTYTTDTMVTTQKAGSIAVVATTILKPTYSGYTSGYNGQHLIVTVKKP